MFIKAGSVRPVAADCVCDQTMFCLVTVKLQTKHLNVVMLQKYKTRE